MNSNTLPIYRAAINRANAQKSTGPKTDAGKKRSSLNAPRHGLTGQVVLPTEELSAYKLFAAGMLKDLLLEPKSPDPSPTAPGVSTEPQAIENNLCALALNGNADSVVTDHPEAHAALVMAKSIASQIKTLATASNAASSVISTSSASSGLERREREASKLYYAAKLYESHVKENKAAGTSEPYDPAAHGFVILLAQVEACALRDKVKELAHAAA